jgi:hypothetical protein
MKMTYDDTPITIGKAEFHSQAPYSIGATHLYFDAYRVKTGFLTIRATLIHVTGESFYTLAAVDTPGAEPIQVDIFTSGNRKVEEFLIQATKSLMTQFRYTYEEYLRLCSVRLKQTQAPFRDYLEHSFDLLLAFYCLPDEEVDQIFNLIKE